MFIIFSFWMTQTMRKNTLQTYLPLMRKNQSYLPLIMMKNKGKRRQKSFIWKQRREYLSMQSRRGFTKLMSKVYQCVLWCFRLHMHSKVTFLSKMLTVYLLYVPWTVYWNWKSITWIDIAVWCANLFNVCLSRVDHCIIYTCILYQLSLRPFIPWPWYLTYFNN